MTDLKSTDTTRKLNNPNLKDTVFSFGQLLTKEQEISYSKWIYVNVLRKIVLFFLLSLNMTYYGLNVEYRRDIYDWVSTTIIELVLLPLFAIDVIIVTIFFIVNMVTNKNDNIRKLGINIHL